MKYWSRDDTKEWISQLEHRLEDIDYFLNRTSQWLDDNDIEDPHIAFMCSFLTCIWVSHMRGEPISFTELMELLEVDEWECDEDKVYEMDEKWANLDHDVLLERVVEQLLDDEDEDYE
jgi:hypothetical protein